MSSTFSVSRLLRPESKHITSYLLNVLLAILCTFLIFQNHELKSAGDKGLNLLFEPGARVEPFHYTNLEGTEAIIQFGDSELRRFFFIFTTTCPHCLNSLAEVQKLVDLTVRLENIQIIGISVDSREQTLQYYLDNKLRFPIYSAGDDFIRKYSSLGVPIFVLVKGDGVVLKAWRGELQSSRGDEILTLLTGS